MLKKIAIGVGVVVFSVPVFAAADTNVQTQLISLYQSLVQVLQKQLQLLAGPSKGVLQISPQSGPAPLAVTFTLQTVQGNEAIDFGDGHSTGSSGCTKNAQGYCDLSKPVTHQYALPGTYKVSLLRTVGATVETVTSSSVTVTK